MKVLIKSMRPHRQKILTNDGEEVRLQQWANKKAAESLRTAGGDASGEQFTQARDMLMRDAVENPEQYGLKFMNERVPFEGQNLESSLSEPDYGNSPEEQKVFEHLMSLKPEEQEVLSRNNRTPDLFDSEGKLRDGMPPEEGKKRGPIYTNVSYDSNVGTPTEEEIDQMTSEQQRGFDANKEAEHLRRIMTSRQVPMRDAWSILKNLQFPADAGNRREFQRMPGEEHGPNDKFFRYGEDPYVPKGHGSLPFAERPRKVERPHPYSQLGADVMEDYQLMQEEPEDNQLLTPDELAFAQLIAENDMRMPPAASIPAPTLRQGMNQYNP